MNWDDVVRLLRVVVLVDEEVVGMLLLLLVSHRWAALHVHATVLLLLL